MSLVSLFHSHALRAPSAEAVVAGQRRLSYGELWQQVAAVAGFLRGQDLAEGARVGLLLDNCPEYIAAYYGAWAAGGVTVALNSAAKARDVANCLSHSGASWLVADAAHPELAEILPRLPEGLKLLLVGEGVAADGRVWPWAQVLDHPPLDAPLEQAPGKVAAIIYTSGTTGDPKGVTLSHGNLLSNSQAIIEYLRLSADDRVMHVLPFHYSYGNSVLHTHLAVGASLVLESNLVYPHRVLARMVEEGVTGFSGVPSTYALLLGRTRLDEYDLSRLRYMTQAGGAMAPAQVRRVRELLPWVEFFVMYGQTEASARIAYLPPSMLEPKAGSVGIPLRGTEIVIRGEAGEPVDVGVSGQIWVRGPHVMRGYWSNPDATAEVLADGWLCTGDLGHFDSDGFLYIDGRASDMIKTGAHRVSPKEIEEVVLELEQVAEVAAVGVPDELMGQLIRVVIVLRPDAELDARAVQAHCRRHLALYKVPRFVEFANDLPKTGSGKVKRFQLATAPVSTATGTGP